MIIIIIIVEKEQQTKLILKNFQNRWQTKLILNSLRTPKKIFKNKIIEQRK